MCRLVSYLFFGLVFLWSLWPLKVHYFFSRILNFFLFKVFKYRIDVIHTNLSKSFPELSAGEIEKITEDFYDNLTDIIAESIWSVAASGKSIRAHTDFEGKDELMKAYNSGRGTITLLAHFQNWEIWGGIPDLKQFYGIDIPNYRFNFAYKRPENKLAENVIYAMRTCHHSVSFVETNTIARHILKDKERKNIYFFACDQFPSVNTHISLTFLNQPTGMISGPGDIARKLKMAVGYWSVRREGRGRYVAKYIPICDDASLYEPGYVTREYARLLENDIRSDKSRWLWSHKRWK